MDTGTSIDDAGASFSDLSAEAQDFVIRAAFGEFDESGPPKVSAAVREEIAQWVRAGSPTAKYDSPLNASKGLDAFSGAVFQGRIRELEELITLSAVCFRMLEGYLGPQWFEAVSNLDLSAPDKVLAEANRIIQATTEAHRRIP
jgi:hypothetical protein